MRRKILHPGQMFPGIGFGNRLMKLPADLHTPEATSICLYWHESAETDPDILWLRDTVRSIFEATSP